MDDALIGGGRLVPVAKQFGLSKSAVARHKTGCLAPKLAAAARVVAPAGEVRQEALRAREIAAGEAVPTLSEITSLTGLLSRLARSLDRLESAADGAAADNAYASLAALSGQLHRGIEAAGRLQGLGGPTSQDSGRAFTININVPELPAARVFQAAPAALVPEVIAAPASATLSGLETPTFRLTFDRAGEPVDAPASWG